MPVATEPKRAVLPLPGGQDGATVRVHPILTGEMHAPPAHTDRPTGRLAKPKLAAQLLRGRGGWDWLPVPAFLVEHPSGGPILIDTGLHPSCVSDISGNMGRAGKLLYEVRMDHDQALRFQLPARGVQPTEIRLVIMTHLHVDHASAVSEFPRGAAPDHHRQFDHAFDWRRLNYEADPVQSFSGFARSLDLFGDGSVRVVSTPGHTLGHQSVVLRTARGEVLVLGDAAYTERELDGDALPLVVHDAHLHRRSLSEIGRYREQTPAAVVIPGHDPQLWPSLASVYE